MLDALKKDYKSKRATKSIKTKVDNPKHDKQKVYSKVTISLTPKQKEELTQYAEGYSIGVSAIIKDNLVKSKIILPYDQQKREYHSVAVKLDDKQYNSLSSYCDKKGYKYRRTF